jgi:pentose-5-phosphate-3-epimerase
MSRYSKKLSPETKRKLSELSSEDPQLVSVLVQIDGSLGPERRSQLEAVGTEVRTVAGDIVTATVPSSEIRQVAELNFVRSLEVSRPLYPETEGEETEQRRKA